MLIKRAYLAGEHDGEPLVRVLRPGEMEKVAGLAPEAQKFCDSLKPDPKFTYVLCNAMGYSEFYGSNSNKDWYGHNPHLDFNGLLHAWEDIGCDVEADRMKGKGWPYGYPCFYGAAVYAHHKNTDPQQLGFGDVIFATLNPTMKRVELVKRVFNEEAQRKGHTSILDRVRAGERVDVSMGCKVPFDFCSICTDWVEVKKAWKTYNPEKHRHPGVAILAYHRTVKPIRGLAVTKVDYCQHMVAEGGKVYPDGRKVFVYNDFPRFFDISFVWIGADRTARVMWSLSSPDVAPSQPRSSAPPGMLERLLNLLSSKTASAKAATIEKDIPGGLAEAAFRDADTAPEIDMTMIVRGSGADPKKILSTLAALGILPTPAEFQSLVLPTMPKGDMLKSAMDARFVTFDTRHAGVDNTFAVHPDHYDAKLAEAFSALMPERSCFAPYLSQRMLSPEDKLASAPRAELGGLLVPELDKLAEMYNGFRISVLEQAPALFPKAAEFLDLDMLSGGEDAGIEPALGELLLGQGPVIQLISSHLRRSGGESSQISKMATFIADSRTFDAMHTIGAALRQTVGVDKTGGLVQAAGHLFGKVEQMV